MELIERRFMFNGSVVGLAGHIRRPKDKIMTVKGSALVPSTGGYVSVEHRGEDIPGLFSFSAISSRVTADFQNRDDARERSRTNPCMDPVLPAVTRVHTRIDNLTIGQRLSVEKVELNLSSFHPGGGAPPEFSSRGSMVVGLRLDGFQLDVRLANDLFSGPLATMQGLNEAFAGDQRLRGRFISDPDDDTKDYNAQPPRIHGDVAFSLVSLSEQDWVGDANPNARFLAPHIVKLNDFGLIHFGEVFVNDEFRQVTLLRVQLGSDDGGDSTAGEGRVNGHGL
jgi:hypothetical protein